MRNCQFQLQPDCKVGLLILHKIEYRTGANNGNADVLFRKPLVQNNVNSQEEETNRVLALETIATN